MLWCLLLLLLLVLFAAFSRVHFKFWWFCCERNWNVFFVVVCFVKCMGIYRWRVLLQYRSGNYCYGWCHGITLYAVLVLFFTFNFYFKSLPLSLSYCSTLLLKFSLPIWIFSLSPPVHDDFREGFCSILKCFRVSVAVAGFTVISMSFQFQYSGLSLCFSIVFYESSTLLRFIGSFVFSFANRKSFSCEF